MKEMKYQQVGDYEFPVLKGEESLPKLTRFGRIYLKHLKENYKVHYLALLAENKINEELKENDQMKWVQEINNIKNIVEKIRGIINKCG